MTYRDMGSGNTTLKRIYHSTMAKCSSLCNAASRSLKCHKAVGRIAHRTLVWLCPTRLNSLYDSLKVLVTLRSELKAICVEVGIPAFRDIELDFISKCVEVLAPISIAVDKLQWQSNESMAFMGALLPTIVSLSDSTLETLVPPKSNANFNKA